MAKIKMTPEQEHTVRNLLWATWEYIGNDIMQAMEAEGQYSIPRDELIEVVLDADHMRTVARNEREKDALGAFKNLSYKEQIAFAKKRFTASHYS